MDNGFFHLSFIVIFILLLVIRAYYHRLAIKHAGKVEFKEGRLIRIIIAAPLLFFLIKFMVNPDFLSWAVVGMPTWLQWFGFGLGVASLPLSIWIHENLGANFSSVLHVREKHTLATGGPYKWVRHPMYTVLFMHFIGILFLTENLLVGGVTLFIFIAVIVGRINNEEKLMTETFGDEYREYMKHTGRFLPKF